ncbi:DNA-binding response regulator [Sneathiella glossodoripedis]|uniref:DNA-binding response regulator n=1 Tax=Sneathiella glossodoripedis TaxID=418853 RepID=UPI0004709F32|nr:DNA-binding response regulator [Sneathiella glossodoripedis]
MNQILACKILFIGRNESDAQQLLWLTSNIKKPEMEVMHVPDSEAILNQRSTADANIILLDADSTGDADFETLKALRATFPELPVVLLTDDEDNIGQFAIRNGAQDYIIRSQLTATGLGRSLISAIERQQGQQVPADTAPLLESATAVLNRLPMGVILVTASSQVLFFNGKAKSFLEKKDGLVLDTNRYCRAVNPAENKQLGELLENALTPSKTEKQEGDFAMSVSREDSDAPLTVMVAPIGTGVAGKGAVLFVSDPVEPVELSIDAICRLYGLTPAEGRLALGLTNGSKLDDLAEEWGVSMHTVRSQLRQIFRKTDTSRQSELVKLILTGPAALKAAPII